MRATERLPIASSRFIRSAGGVALLLVAAAAFGVPSNGDVGVIPAGQNELLAAMLGRGETLAGGCRLTAGGADRGVARATYACPAGGVEVELHYPTGAPTAALHTARFAVVIARGSPPEGFVEDLGRHIRSHEAAFVWNVATGGTAALEGLWRAAVHVNAVLFLVSFIATPAVALWRGGLGACSARWGEIAVVVALTALGAWLRFAAAANLLDHGGIAYDRVLHGATGYLATAQFYSIFYGPTRADIEHAILFNRIAGTLTIPAIYVLCRALGRKDSGGRAWAVIAASLFAVHPLHILFSASDNIAVFSCFLAAVSYALLAAALAADLPPIRAWLPLFAAFAGLALLTQVRPEHVLFLLPAGAFLVVRRERLRAAAVLPPLVAGVAAIAVYIWFAAAPGLAGGKFGNLAAGIEMVRRDLVLNPVTAIPLLFAASAVACRGAGRVAGLGIAALWIAALLVPARTTAEGHHAARVYANWLVLVLPAAARGFARLLGGGRVARVVGGGALLILLAQPFALREVLATRHLEVLEHEAFRRLLEAVPPGTRWVLVPDDGGDAAATGTTLEVFNKYAWIPASIPAGEERPQLVGIGAYLAHPERTNCAQGACLFFFGLPCLDQDVYRGSRERCLEVLRRHRAVVVGETPVVAAPFVHCSIYAGEERRRRCDPARRPRSFVAYRIED